MNIKGLMTYLLMYIIRYTVTWDNGFRIVTHELFDCFIQASEWPSLLVVTVCCELHDLAMFSKMTLYLENNINS